MESGLLILLVLVPILGAIIGALLPDARLAKGWALIVSLFTAIVGVGLALKFDWTTGNDLTWGFPLRGGFNDNIFYLHAFQTGMKFGVDAISLWLVLLTVGLMPLAIAASFDSIREREKEYYAWMLALLAAMNGVFIARDLLMFYVFFELTLVPMFFIIGIWGGPQRRYAAGKFFLFTFTGSVFTLAGIIYLATQSPTGFDMAGAIRYAQGAMTSTQRFWLLLAFLAGFAVKVPLFPVHTWLPLAHTEAPTAGSVILAGVLLKLGTYGLLALAVPIGLTGAALNEVIYSFHLIPGLNWIHINITLLCVIQVLGALCLIGIIYGALVAWVQEDIKKLVAYSSVSHLGFCVLGLIALNTIGVQGSVLYMINHGLSTGALFLVVGMIYDRYHTRDINELSGLAKKMPILAFFFVLFALSSIGLPGLNGFVSEFLTILGAFTSDHLGIAFGSLAALGIILGAVYMLHMLARVVWGPLKVPSHHDDPHAGTERSGVPDELPPDINAREIAILIPLALAVIILGVYPNLILNTIQKPSRAITETNFTSTVAEASVHQLEVTR